MKRALIALALCAVPCSAVVSTAASASAPTSCTKVSGALDSHVDLKGCGGGLGSGEGVFTSASSMVVTWKGHKDGHRGHSGPATTTFALASSTVAATNRCAPHIDKKGVAIANVEYDLTGSVSADTSGRVVVGSPASAAVCVDAHGHVALVDHTVFSFGS